MRDKCLEGGQRGAAAKEVQWGALGKGWFQRGEGANVLVSRKLPVWWAPQGCHSELQEPKRGRLPSRCAEMDG